MRRRLREDKSLRCLKGTFTSALVILSYEYEHACLLWEWKKAFLYIVKQPYTVSRECRHLFSICQRGGDGRFIGILDIATRRESTGDAGDGGAGPFELFLDIEGRDIAFGSRIGG